MELPTIINLMRTMTIKQHVNIEEVHRAFPEETRLYRGRPEMLLMKMSNGRNLQIFRKGTVQILGRASDEEAEGMRQQLLKRLKRVKWMQNSQVTTMTIRNMVVSVQMKREVPLRNIASSNSELMYEAELFPAALIRKWYPAHVAVFHNGKVIFTGLKSLEHFNSIYRELNLYLNSSVFQKRK